MLKVLIIFDQNQKKDSKINYFPNKTDKVTLFKVQYIIENFSVAMSLDF